jgi:hypothetical protein
MTKSKMLPERYCGLETLLTMWPHEATLAA